jgi:hypothetical protein
MLGTMRNLITASMGRSRLGGGGVKCTTDLAPASFFCYRGARSLEADVKYGTAVTPLPSLTAREEVMRRTSAPATAMRVGTGRRDFGGEVWRCRGGRGPPGGGSAAELAASV